MLRSYKYRLYPNESQKKLFTKVFGCVRFIWNKNVEVWNKRGDFKTSTEYRREYEFLKEVSAATIQQKEIDFKRFKAQKFNKKRKKKLGAPSFKSKHDKQSFRLPNQKFKIEGNKIQLERIGKVRIKIDRVFKGVLKSVTVSKDLCNEYYASILVEEKIELKEKTYEIVGIDVGIRAMITTSDSLQVYNLPDSQRKIKHIQRRFSRKKKGSNRFKRLKFRIAKLYRKKARQRNWLLHNISTCMVNNYDVIVVEDLNISGMMKNHHLAGAVGRSSWGELINQFEYKTKFYGKELIKVNRFFPSSKLCSNCGVIKEDLTLSDRVYKCDCGLEVDRDLNAALNLKAVGVTAAQQSVMECKTYEGEQSLKQAIPRDLISFL